MALVLPLLLFLVCGIIDFGRMLNAQITVSAAAREGARAVALRLPDVPGRVNTAAATLSPLPTTTVTASCPVNPTATQNGSVVVTYPFTFVTPMSALSGFFPGGSIPGSVSISGRGVMRCGG